MALTVVIGDLFADPAEVWADPVNCLGVSGAGLAAEFRRRFPAAEAVWSAAARRGEVRPGTVLILPSGAEEPTHVAFVPTKRHWRDPSRLADVAAGLAGLRRAMDDAGLASAAVPALGCGLGRLPFADVADAAEAVFGAADAPAVRLYRP